MSGVSSYSTPRRHKADVGDENRAFELEVVLAPDVLSAVYFDFARCRSDDDVRRRACSKGDAMAVHHRAGCPIRGRHRVLATIFSLAHAHAGRCGWRGRLFLRAPTYWAKFGFPVTKPFWAILVLSACLLELTAFVQVNPHRPFSEVFDMKILFPIAIAALICALAMPNARSALGMERPSGVAAEAWVPMGDSAGFVVTGHSLPSGMNAIPDRNVMIPRPALRGYFVVKRGDAWYRVDTIPDPAIAPAN